tara:strand:+ start:8070 stop:8366 length:297 start_codon:yes stop_codon:yes gene_type:complete
MRTAEILNDLPQQPNFKPGQTAHTQLGDETLNANVPWADVINDILTSGQYSLDSLATKIQTTAANVMPLLDNDASPLDFKTGAKLLSVHCIVKPEMYI